MRHDFKKQLPDGVHQYGDFANYHVWYDKVYLGGFANKTDAENRLRKAQKKKPIVRVTRENGLHQESASGYWSVWYDNIFWGTFKFKVSALAKLKHVRAARRS